MGVRGRERSGRGLLRRSAFLLLVVVTAAVCLVAPQWAAAADVPACPAPPEADASLTGAEAELRELRREQVQSCEVMRPAVVALAANDHGLEVRNDEGSGVGVYGDVTVSGSINDYLHEIEGWTEDTLSVLQTRLPPDLDMEGGTPRLRTTAVATGGTFELGDEAKAGLDLTWWGVWFLAGVTLCLLFSQLWHRVWKFWR